MADTLLQMAKKLRAIYAAVPYLSCQEYIKNAYAWSLDWSSDGWSFQFGRGQFIVNQSVLGTASVTQNSTLITATAVSQGTIPGDNSTLVGRQVLFAGMSPIYSIIDNPTTTTFDIDQPYGNITKAAINFEISNIYFTPPADYERLIAIVDPPNNWQLPFDIHVEELNNEDPQRSSTGTPWLLADVTWNSQYLALLPAGITDSFGQTNASASRPLKEIWPRQQAAYVYPFVYKRRLSISNPTVDQPAGFMRPDIIIEKAKADCCAYPGTSLVPNLAYNMINSQNHWARAEKMLQDFRLIDASIAERSLDWVGTYTKMKWNPMSARFTQQHVMTPGGFGSYWGE